VVVIGESARRENCSLYGYERNTNPLLANNNVTPLMAESSATYTTAGVKAILDHKPSKELYEILPNYLYRNGVEVIWRSCNWGEPPLHIEHYYSHSQLRELYPEVDGRYDGILLAGLGEQIAASDKDKILVVLHCSTSHGPSYYQKYPSDFERFTPVCRSVEMANADHDELINAYDNTILYTDYLLHSLIEILSGIEDRESTMLFISDHGESLGEDNLYMHGVPMSMAPKQQYEIPFIVWQSNNKLKIKPLEMVGHYNVFHSVLRILSVDSPIYDDSKSIFE
jgi:lipid A ethanolaminephosphotransferase